MYSYCSRLTILYIVFIPEGGEDPIVFVPGPYSFRSRLATSYIVFIPACYEARVQPIVFVPARFFQIKGLKGDGEKKSNLILLILFYPRLYILIYIYNIIIPKKHKYSGRYRG